MSVARGQFNPATFQHWDRTGGHIMNDPLHRRFKGDSKSNRIKDASKRGSGAPAAARQTKAPKAPKE